MSEKDILSSVLNHVYKARILLQGNNVSYALKELNEAVSLGTEQYFDKEEFTRLLNDHYGTSLSKRFRKLNEEFNELMEVVESDETATCYQSDLIDELADLTGVLYHITSIVGKTNDDMLRIVSDKIRGRDINPNYRRKHPHKKTDYKTTDRNG